MKAILVFLLGLFIITLGHACTSAAQQTAAQDLAETVTAATKDGVVTPEEAQAIQVKMQGYIDAPGVDWAALGGTVLASIAATFLGLRYAPNSVIIGKAEAAALNRTAGLA
jgi:hypothetical protein